MLQTNFQSYWLAGFQAGWSDLYLAAAEAHLIMIQSAYGYVVSIQELTEILVYCCKILNFEFTACTHAYTVYVRPWLAWKLAGQL